MQLSDTEWRVMNRVWTKHPATARTVLDALEGETGWAYTTVKTILGRLVEKGALRVAMEGNTSVYAPILTREQARRSAVRTLLDRAFDGGFGPLVHFLANDRKLSRRERTEIRRLLEEEGKA